MIIPLHILNGFAQTALSLLPPSTNPPPLLTTTAPAPPTSSLAAAIAPSILAGNVTTNALSDSYISPSTPHIPSHSNGSLLVPNNETHTASSEQSNHTLLTSPSIPNPGHLLARPIPWVFSSTNDNTSPSSLAALGADLPSLLSGTPLDGLLGPSPSSSTSPSSPQCGNKLDLSGLLGTGLLAHKKVDSSKCSVYSCKGEPDCRLFFHSPLPWSLKQGLI